MAQSINLMPQQEVEEQTKVRLVKVSTMVSVFILLVVLGVAGYFLYTQLNLKKEISLLDSAISSLRDEITSLSKVEVIARNLDKKYQTLSGIFSSRPYYSLLMQEIDKRRPNTVSITSFNIREGNKANVSGKAQGYISVADFTTNLLNKNFEGGDPKLKTLIKSVTLNSVSLESKSGDVSYAILVEFNKEMLKR